MKYINESLLDILSSLEKGEMPKEIGLDDFAPDANENSIDYDASKDPERKMKEAKAVIPPVPDAPLYGGSSHSGEAPSPELAALMDVDATEITNDADFIFKDMENIVKAVILGHADKRHALIAGDPGVGKCMDASEKITLLVPDNF
ncbi:MAG: hypothetical protein IKK93_03185 [Campylobacter sp.]|nr:hypothetical protein [Campylobacter sp.]